MTRPKREPVGADTFVAAGLAEHDGFDRLPREDLAHHLERKGDEFLIRWPGERVECLLTSLRDHSDGVSGELSVSHAGVPLHWGRLGLASTPAREGVVRKLSSILPHVPWRTILEATCRATAQALRLSVPAVVLAPRRRTGEPYLLDPVAPVGQTTIGFAPGGAGKSLYGLAASAAVVTGLELPGGLRPRQTGPILYLDWESSQEDHEDRLALLEGGLGVPLHSSIFYQPMTRALVDDLPGLRALVAREAIIGVIVDSLAPACGAEPETADSAIRLMNGLRSFGPSVTRLVLAHVPHTGGHVFGSVFFTNLARSVWEIRRAEDDGAGAVTLALYHRKSNSSRLHAPLGVQFLFEDSRIIAHGVDLAREPDLLAGAATWYRAKAALTTGAKTAEEIAEHMGETVDTVKRSLRRWAGRKLVIQLEPGSKGHPARWGLTA